MNENASIRDFRAKAINWQITLGEWSEDVRKIGYTIGRSFGRPKPDELVVSTLERAFEDMERLQNDCEKLFTELQKGFDDLPAGSIKNEIYFHHIVPFQAVYSGMLGSLRGVKMVVEGYVEKSRDVEKMQEIVKKLKRSKEKGENREKKVIGAGFHGQMYV